MPPLGIADRDLLRAHVVELEPLAQAEGRARHRVVHEGRRPVSGGAQALGQGPALLGHVPGLVLLGLALLVAGELLRIDPARAREQARELRRVAGRCEGGVGEAGVEDDRFRGQLFQVRRRRSGVAVERHVAGRHGVEAEQDDRDALVLGLEQHEAVEDERRARGAPYEPHRERRRGGREIQGLLEPAPGGLERDRAALQDLTRVGRELLEIDRQPTVLRLRVPRQSETRRAGQLEQEPGRLVLAQGQASVARCRPFDHARSAREQVGESGGRRRSRCGLGARGESDSSGQQEGELRGVRAATPQAPLEPYASLRRRGAPRGSTVHVVHRRVLFAGQWTCRNPMARILGTSPWLPAQSVSSTCR